MKLENQVCTLHHASELKNIGVAQKSLFYYHPAYTIPKYGMENHVGVKICNLKDECQSAYTVAELAKAIGVDEGQEHLRATIERKMNQSHTFMLLYNAELLGTCLLELIKENILTVDEINKRLSA